MGLFSRKKKEPAPEPAPVEARTPRVPDPNEIVELGGFKFYFAKPEDETDQRWTQDVNMTTKMVKVDVPEGDEGLYLKRVYLYEDGGKILGKQGDDVVFEVTKRSKAYNEMLPFVRQRAGVSIYNRDGDYGRYYNVRLKFPIVIL